VSFPHFSGQRSAVPVTLLSTRDTTEKLLDLYLPKAPPPEEEVSPPETARHRPQGEENHRSLFAETEKAKAKI